MKQPTVKQGRGWALRGLAAAAFFVALAWAKSASAAGPTVSITSPASGALSGNSLVVAARVDSTLAMKTVHAQVGTANADLTSTDSTTFTGTVALAGLQHGAQSLVVTATDVLDQAGVATIPFVLDRPPTIVVSEPIEGTVARPDLSVKASCSDEEGCTSIKFLSGATVLAGGTSSIDTSLSFPSYDGNTLSFTFQATDTSGQVTVAQVKKVYVDSSPNLTLYRRVGGTVLDFDATRVLFVDDQGLKIHLESDGADHFIKGFGAVALSKDQALQGLAGRARLSRDGAIFWSYPFTGTGGGIWEWANDSLLELDPVAGPCGTPTVRHLVNGNYAVWSQPTATLGKNNIVLRNLTTRANTVVGTGYGDCDIAVNGDVVWAAPPLNSGCSVYRSRGMMVDTLVSDCGVWSLTDGINVAFDRVSGFAWDIGLFTQSESTLAHWWGNAAPNSYAAPGVDVLLEAGWIAYREPGIDHVPRVFRRAPGGMIDQPGIWKTESQLDAINPLGEVMTLNDAGPISQPDGGPPPVKERYSTKAGTLVPQRVSHAFGSSVWFQSNWYIVIGPAVFAVSPSGQPDASAPDAALASDAAAPAVEAGQDTLAMDAAQEEAPSAALPDASAVDAGEAAVVVPDAGTSPGDVDSQSSDALQTPGAPGSGSADGASSTLADGGRRAETEAGAGTNPMTPPSAEDDSGCAIRSSKSPSRFNPALLLTLLALGRRARRRARR